MRECGNVRVGETFEFNLSYRASKIIGFTFVISQLFVLRYIEAALSCFANESILDL